jgi:hypothetical protein
MGGKINNEDIGSLSWEVGDMSLAPVPLEMSWHLWVPRVGIEILGQEVAWVSGVYRLESKLMVPSLCKASIAQIRLDGGYKLSVFDYMLAEGTQTFWSKEVISKNQNCP